MRLDRERLLDIMGAIEAIDRYRLENKADFDGNELVRVWCLRHLEIIGEAAANVSVETRALDQAIPWKQIVGMRNTLVHAYFDVDWNLDVEQNDSNKLIRPLSFRFKCRWVSRAVCGVTHRSVGYRPTPFIPSPW